MSSNFQKNVILSLNEYLSLIGYNFLDETQEIAYNLNGVELELAMQVTSDYQTAALTFVLEDTKEQENLLEVAMQVTNNYQLQALGLCVVYNVKDKVEYGKDQYDCAPYILSFTNNYQVEALSYYLRNFDKENFRQVDIPSNFVLDCVVKIDKLEQLEAAKYYIAIGGFAFPFNNFQNPYNEILSTTKSSKNYLIFTGRFEYTESFSEINKVTYLQREKILCEGSVGFCKRLSYKIVSIIDALGDLISPGEMCRIPDEDLYYTCTVLYDDPAIDLLSKSDSAFCTGIANEICAIAKEIYGS